MQYEPPNIKDLFNRLASGYREPTMVANVSVMTWRNICAALSPIIGHRGVLALYKRSLFLTRGAYPFLGEVAERAEVAEVAEVGEASANDEAEGPSQQGEWSHLYAGLSQQTTENAISASAALLQTFSDLLITLIGESLTVRLFQSIWHHPSSGEAAQDISS